MQQVYNEVITTGKVPDVTVTTDPTPRTPNPHNLPGLEWLKERKRGRGAVTLITYEQRRKRLKLCKAKGRARMLLGEFMTFCDETGWAFPTLDDLADATGLSVRTLRRYIEALEASGDLYVNRANRFHIYGVPNIPDAVPASWHPSQQGTGCPVSTPDDTATPANGASIPANVTAIPATLTGKVPSKYQGSSSRTDGTEGEGLLGIDAPELLAIRGGDEARAIAFTRKLDLGERFAKWRELNAAKPPKRKTAWQRWWLGFLEKSNPGTSQLLVEYQGKLYFRDEYLKLITPKPASREDLEAKYRRPSPTLESHQAARTDHDA